MSPAPHPHRTRDEPAGLLQSHLALQEDPGVVVVDEAAGVVPSGKIVRSLPHGVGRVHAGPIEDPERDGFGLLAVEIEADRGFGIRLREEIDAQRQ
ncbi:MAG: hypothetical protein R3E12_11865 [Candidatus Eisenbacteria bacterium]